MKKKIDNLDEIYLDQHQCFQKKTESKKLKANLAVPLSLSETIYVNILLLLKQFANRYYGSKCQHLSLMRTRASCLELSIYRRQVPIIVLMIF